MHPHVPPVSRVTLSRFFKGGLNLKRVGIPLFIAPFTVLQILFLISVCLKIVKKISYYNIIKFFSCFYTVVERENETTVKL